MKNKFITIIISCILFSFFIVNSSFCLSVDPDIDQVNSGPFKDDGNNRERFRVIVILNEVSLKLFVQRINYGEENCCAKVSSTYEIDDTLLEGENKLYSISDFKWLTFNSFSFTGNSTRYIIRDIDSKYQCVKQSKKR